jgi:CDP-paratose 2-epimerase
MGAPSALSATSLSDWLERNTFKERVKKMSTILITGGAGFIGSNAAAVFSKRGVKVVAVDNLSRATSAKNRAWIETLTPSVDFVELDILDNDSLERLVADVQPNFVLHLAAQVAVTESVRQPRTDFQINALGTLNVLEAIRAHCPASRLIYASTNKVYGDMKSLEVREGPKKYSVEGLKGVSESFPLDFYSPYGCSKGAADQYVLDYGRNYGLKTMSLRQSCIYGPRQFGVEDQGWMAWFAIAALRRERFTIYGDGKQVRDALYVDDLIELYWMLFESASWPGGSLNVGGGWTSLSACSST